MTHRAAIEVGPATIRRSCCDNESTDAAAALEWIDEPFALADGEPVEVSELLRSVLACPVTVESIEIIHPSWWPTRRVELVVTAAHGLADDVVTRPRFALLREAFQAAVVIEIAAGLVAITAADVVAEPRIGAPEEVVEAVARRVAAAERDSGAVLIDAPIGVGGAQALADMIAERLPGEVTVVDELPLSRAESRPTNPEPAPAPARTGGRLWVPLTAAAVLSVVAVGVRAHPDTDTTLTNLVEGRVAVQVPADWSLRRVTAGPGSARVEVVSPTDPRLMLHITQAPAGGETLAVIAEPLQRAMELAEAETPGVFVGFDPAGSSAGRPAVTYREVRDDHHVDWAVLVDRAVRIGIGCQSGPDGDDALRAVCEQAVRSAHALGSPPAR